MYVMGNKVNCDPHDLEWIKETVSKIPHRQLITGVLNKYNQVYQSGQNGTLQQAGAARRNANNRLRVYVKRLLESQK